MSLYWLFGRTWGSLFRGLFWVSSEFIPPRETAIVLQELARAIPEVAAGVGSDVGMPIAIYERKVTTIGSAIREFADHLHSPADDDRFGFVVIPRFTSGFNTARQFNGNESFVKFRAARHMQRFTVIYGRGRSSYDRVTWLLSR